MTRYLLLSLLLLSACRAEDVDPRIIIAESADNRVAALQASILRNCEADVLRAAITRADSLLLDRARMMRRVEGRPPRPGRPGELAPKLLSKPLPLRPLFPFEIRFDTLLRDSLLLDSLRQDSIMRDSFPLLFDTLQ